MSFFPLCEQLSAAPQAKDTPDNQCVYDYIIFADKKQVFTGKTPYITTIFDTKSIFQYKINPAHYAELSRHKTGLIYMNLPEII